MSSYLFEIVELSDGEFALKKPDSEDEPLVTIQFSAEAKGFLSGNKAEIAKAMIEAGIEQAEHMASEMESDWKDADAQERTIH